MIISSCLQQVLNIQPYHIDALLQLSDVCKMSDDTAMATDLIGEIFQKHWIGLQFHINSFQLELINIGKRG